MAKKTNVKRFEQYDDAIIKFAKCKYPNDFTKQAKEVGKLRKKYKLADMLGMK